MAPALAIAAAAPASLLAWFWVVARLERRYVAAAISCLLGGAALFLPAGLLNGYAEGLGGPAATLFVFVVAPISEELLKCVPPLFFLRGRPRASQGLVLGLASGTGFAIVENCAYVLAEPDWRVAVARALSTSIVHSTSTALIVFVVCQLFKHEHHHRGAAIGVAASGVMLRRVAVRLILRAIAPGAGRATVAIGLVSVLVSLTFLIGFLFVWFTMGALQEELQAERSELKSGSRQS